MTTRHNACTNPSAKHNVTGWGGNMTPTQATGVTGMPRTTAARYDNSGSFLRTPPGAANPGDTVTLSCYIKPDGNASGTLYVVPLDSGGGDIAFYPVSYSGSAGTATRISSSATMPAGTVEVQLLVDAIVNVYVTAVLNETTDTLGTWFDGDSTNASWDGADGNSSSTLTDAPAFTDPTADAATATVAAGGAKGTTVGTALPAGAAVRPAGAKGVPGPGPQQSGLALTARGVKGGLAPIGQQAAAGIAVSGTKHVVAASCLALSSTARAAGTKSAVRPVALCAAILVTPAVPVTTRVVVVRYGTPQLRWTFGAPQTRWTFTLLP